MVYERISFIGGGRIVRILLRAFQNASHHFEAIKVYEKDGQTFMRLKSDYPQVEAASLADAFRQDLVILALHPPVLVQLLAELEGTCHTDATIVSLAPKVTTTQIGSSLHTDKVVRMIPSATSLIGKGYNPVAFHPSFDEAEKETILALLKPTGHVFETTEKKLGGYVIASAMLPTYFWYQLQELQQIAMQTALDGEESKQAIQQTLTAALELFFKAGMSADEVIDLIPAKPMGEAEPLLRKLYQEKLLSLYEKIK